MVSLLALAIVTQLKINLRANYKSCKPFSQQLDHHSCGLLSTWNLMHIVGHDSYRENCRFYSLHLSVAPIIGRQYE